MRPGPGGEVEERHAGAAEARDGVEQVQERWVAQLGVREDFIAPHRFAQRPEDAGGEERGDAEERKDPAEERTFGRRGGQLGRLVRGCARVGDGGDHAVTFIFDLRWRLAGELWFFRVRVYRHIGTGSVAG